MQQLSREIRELFTASQGRQILFLGTHASGVLLSGNH